MDGWLRSPREAAEVTDSRAPGESFLVGDFEELSFVFLDFLDEDIPHRRRFCRLLAVQSDRFPSLAPAFRSDS